MIQSRYYDFVTHSSELCYRRKNIQDIKQKSQYQQMRQRYLKSEIQSLFTVKVHVSAIGDIQLAIVFGVD